MKICISCHLEKDISAFTRRGDSSRGECRSCGNKRKTKWKRDNPERQSEHTHRYYAKKKGVDPESCRKIYRTAEEKQSLGLARKRHYYIANREKVLAYEEKRRKVKKNEISLYHKAWRLANADLKSERDKAWRRQNPDKVAEYSNKRRFRRLRAQPPWLTAIEKAQIAEFYQIASARSMQTGIMHHVDHIHALKGENFSGLHVPWNLQVMIGTENQSKGQRLPESDIHLAWNY